MGALTTAEAYDALSSFASSYGPDPLLLLLHASVPETLRPDILHLIQINFLAGPADPSREADVLFAPFTTCLGGDYYRIDAQVRWHALALLRSLYREESRGREVRVAELLWCHLEQLERGQRITAQTLLGDYIAVQRWVALAYLEPSDAARAFAQALRAVEAHASADSITAYAQLGGLAAALELPLAGEPELLTYAKGLDALAKGDEPNATRLLEALGDQPLQIGEVSLKAPTQWLGHQVEKQLQRQLEEQLQRQLEEQKMWELVEQQPQAEAAISALERQPVATDPPEVVVPTVAAIRLQRFSTTTCLLRQKSGRWQNRSGQDRWRQEHRQVQVEGFLEQLDLEASAIERLYRDVAITMVKIPGGTLLMGSPREETERSDDEGPLHEVKLESFFMGQTPITQAQWREVAGWQERPGEQWGRQLELEPSYHQNKGMQGENKPRLLAVESNIDQCPVERVSWWDAMEFCDRLSQRTGRSYTLPSEAQWEYACRAGTTTPFCFGETISPDLANYNGDFTYLDGPKGVYREQTSPVVLFPANAWGMQDMHGNVWEWCADHWHPNYYGAPNDGSPRINPDAKEEEVRLLRGGSWFSHPENCRSAYRVSNHPGCRYDHFGFRVCCLPQD
jgi:formylglycine-generating enzyme required for sulfatase activity